MKGYLQGVWKVSVEKLKGGSCGLRDMGTQGEPKTGVIKKDRSCRTTYITQNIFIIILRAK